LALSFVERSAAFACAAFVCAAFVFAGGFVLAPVADLPAGNGDADTSPV
jgi:hypothetical protein